MVGGQESPPKSLLPKLGCPFGFLLLVTTPKGDRLFISGSQLPNCWLGRRGGSQITPPLIIPYLGLILAPPQKKTEPRPSQLLDANFWSIFSQGFNRF